MVDTTVELFRVLWYKEPYEKRMAPLAFASIEDAKAFVEYGEDNSPWEVEWKEAEEGIIGFANHPRAFDAYIILVPRQECIE